MRILFDHCVPKPLAEAFTRHTVELASSHGWARLKNGRLLAAAAAAKFDLFLTVDKNIRHQQNPASLPLPVIILDSVKNTPEALAPIAAFVLPILEKPLPNVMMIVDPTGKLTMIS